MSPQWISRGAVLGLVGQHGVVRVGAADAGGARAGPGGVVGDAEMQRLVARARAGDRVDVGHAERGLDDQLEAEPLLPALRLPRTG